ncbi:UvrD-helicase domain-containing protein [Pseudomonas corrugata]|uniref:UvrD-helicase domain-containing protein n=1 Tax=Pseudomonas corrugata TaxID=47879 RepID=UPI0028C45530|nr:UvrD-helicase domain-containing protein [Pseudomonas corrugata]MDU9026239.1 UvrD-helicase domain-containing protein [Pseudomonas corrugata]
MPNLLTLAVAGGRKTQGLVDHCKELPTDRRVLIVTFTQTNQQELIHRLGSQAGDRHNIEVLGWYTFLLRNFAKPFLPLKFPRERVGGFNFEGRPSMYANGKHRFMDGSNQIYACELGRLARELMAATPALIRRLECLYDEILIDEVQDLSGYDWEIVHELLESRIDVRMVGDVRQAVLSTNPRGQKNKQYGYAGALEWFLTREKGGLLSIEYATTTYRCRTEIATFSDSIFDASWGFPETTSENHVASEHDGVYLLHSKHIDQYVERYRPQCLRSSIASGKEFPLDFMNFKVSKGATFERVLIMPTAPIKSFIQKQICLESTSAAAFYVAATRAKQSLAIIIDKPGSSKLPVWAP